VHGKSIIVSANRVKPACVFNEHDCGHTNFKPAVAATPATAPSATTTTTTSSDPDYTLRSPRPFPCMLHLLTINLCLGGGGDVETSHMNGVEYTSITKRWLDKHISKVTYRHSSKELSESVSSIRSAEKHISYTCLRISENYKNIISHHNAPSDQWSTWARCKWLAQTSKYLCGCLIAYRHRQVPTVCYFPRILVLTFCLVHELSTYFNTVLKCIIYF
jgi:hypothetical protein